MKQNNFLNTCEFLNTWVAQHKECFKYKTICFQSLARMC